MNSVTHKKCPSCGIDQLLTEFPPDKTRRLGVRSNCKECCRIKAYKYRSPTKNIPKKRMYPEKKPIDKELRKKKRHENYEKNKEKVLLMSKLYRKEHPEVSRKATAKWRRNNSEKSKELQRIHESQRRALKRNSEGIVTNEEWLDLCNKYGNVCLCCRRGDLKLTLDHVVPLALGGKHLIENIQPLCKSCNCKKHTKIIDYRIQYV